MWEHPQWEKLLYLVSYHHTETTVKKTCDKFLTTLFVDCAENKT